MPGDQATQDKVQKTGELLLFSHLFMSPFYHKMGAFASLTLTAAALVGLHEIGRAKRSGQGFFGFFTGQSNARTYEPATIRQNIMHGGAEVHDKVMSSIPSRK